MKKATFPQFAGYACIGDSITWQAEGFDITATLQSDTDTHPDDFDCYSKKEMAAWKNNDWFYVSVVLSVSKNGIGLEDHAASLSAVDCNFPSVKKFPNTYLSECALDMESVALEAGRVALADMLAKLQA